MSEPRFIEGLVSTIIPVFNRPVQLREAVASVLAQDWQLIEILIVDDGSTDETATTAAELAKEHAGTVRVLRRANGGPGAARETGRLAARGEFIQYLDSDDALLPGKFSAQVAALRGEPDADVAYGITHLRLQDGKLAPGPHKLTGQRIAAMFPDFLVSRWWETATPLYRRRAVDRAGPWTTARMEEDWEYDCRIAALGGRLAWVDRPVAEHRQHAGPRLSRSTTRDAAVMRDRARSHALILAHARRAGITSDAREMQHFARALFLLARQCGAAGLACESRELLRLARDAGGQRSARALDYVLYTTFANILGWRFAGKVSAWIDLMRTRHA
jgi:hypothetical protein